MDFKSQVLAATDIVALIGQTVALKRRGKDYVGLCPFHGEKTPSFHVSPSKQFFHCYGCKAGGNAIDFVIKRDRLEFVEAMRLLGEKAGLQMPRMGMTKEKTSEKQLLLDIHSAATAFFQNQLREEQAGAAARDYLEKRGFTAESIKKFQIGYAPDSWDSLLATLRGKFPPSALALAGVVKPRTTGDGYYDTFRNRLMFPIKDETGRVIAFGGRVMPGSDDPAKYLNSPETPLFSKSRCVFGLDAARQRIVESPNRAVTVVEGYTDVVMSHQYGVSNVVSILGTALTEQHLGILRRFADRVVLLFDADTAGDTAVNRSVELFITQPVEIAIASIPEDLDPDEYLLKHGKDAFDSLMTNAADALTFKWKLLDRQYRAAEGDLTAQQKIVEQYLDNLSTARGTGPVDAIRWGSVINRVSRLIGIPVDEINKRFKNRPAGKRPTPESVIPATEQVKTATIAWTAELRAQRQILGILLIEPQRWVDVQATVSQEDFTERALRQLAEVYWNHQRDEGEPVFAEFLGVLDDSLKDLALSLVEEAEELKDLDVMLTGAISHLEQSRGRQEEMNLLAELRRKNEASARQEDQEISLLKLLQEKARQPNLRRA